MKPYTPHRILNKLFKKNYRLYWPIYSVYKMISDRTERKLIKSVVQKGDVVVDIGANIGAYTRFFAQLVGPGGKVVAFEPEMRNFNVLSKLNNQHKHVVLENLAIGEKRSVANLYISEDLNVDHRSYQAEDIREKCIVQMDCLDNYRELTKINFIKLDIQGFEYSALLGMRNILKKNRDIKILMEFWPFGIHQAGQDHEQLIALLKELEFLTYIIDGYRIINYRRNMVKMDYKSYYNLFATRTPYCK